MEITLQMKVDMVGVLNNFFASIFTVEDNTVNQSVSPPPPPPPPPRFNQPVPTTSD